MSDVTRILSQIETGDACASEQLLPLVYDELRKLAAARLASERSAQTLQATALVHEAYLRLVNGEARQWDSRGHFFAAAAEAMRRILIGGNKGVRNLYLSFSAGLVGEGLFLALDAERAILSIGDRRAVVLFEYFVKWRPVHLRSAGCFRVRPNLLDAEVATSQ